MNTNTQLTETDGELVLPSDPPLDEASPKLDAIDVDALQAENDELRNAIRLRDARDQIKMSLKAAGARSPELLFAAAKESLQFSDDGSLVNAEAITADLKRKFPEQFGLLVPPPIDGGAGSSAGANILTKEALSRMKPDEVGRLNWDQVRSVLRN